MITLGLTGSIGMGKSFAAYQFKRYGVEIFDADAEVHKLLAPDGAAFKEVSEEFPQSVVSGKIDRKKLGDVVFSNKKKLEKLEEILHPIVREKELHFLKICHLHRKDIVLLDIPLLFETGADALCDYVIVVTASPIVQKNRVERGRGMKPEKLAQINELQMSDADKVKRADFVIHTGLDKRYVIEQINGIMKKLTG